MVCGLLQFQLNVLNAPPLLFDDHCSSSVCLIYQYTTLSVLITTVMEGYFSSRFLLTDLSCTVMFVWILGRESMCSIRIISPWASQHDLKSIFTLTNFSYMQLWWIRQPIECSHTMSVTRIKGTFFVALLSISVTLVFPVLLSRKVSFGLLLNINSAMRYISPHCVLHCENVRVWYSYYTCITSTNSATRSGYLDAHAFAKTIFVALIIIQQETIA